MGRSSLLSNTARLLLRYIVLIVTIAILMTIFDWRSAAAFPARRVDDMPAWHGREDEALSRARTLCARLMPAAVPPLRVLHKVTTNTTGHRRDQWVVWSVDDVGYGQFSAIYDAKTGAIQRMAWFDIRTKSTGRGGDGAAASGEKPGPLNADRAVRIARGYLRLLALPDCGGPDAVWSARLDLVLGMNGSPCWYVKLHSPRGAVLVTLDATTTDLTQINFAAGPSPSR